MTAALRTDVGRVRKQNEDAAWLNEKRGIYVVADGMGGHLAGEVASAMAIDAIKHMAEKHDIASIAVLREAVVAAHEAICARARENTNCSGMGTTLSAMWRGGHYMYIAHVGDSRIYRFRRGALEQITQDHSLVEELVRAGIISREEARNHPRRNIITRALGTQGENAPDLLAADMEKGDLWLLCTDGLSSMISDEEIARVLGGKESLEKMADTLMKMALAAGGRDNVTLILCRSEEG
ncbi:MAG: Stp1/IreP family PP2C-type Ser/Thr phosphatase [Clostridia bacterium]|nr:Stp1/IreP family PP2C-type Ser/Thr phosphatase [Clostridia bacterium]